MDPIILPRISDKKPLVSVVSITYNHEPYIRDCLEGFLMQKTNFPVEIIIHDDASTDHTADIIREYYEKRPDLFHVILERENQYSQGKIIGISLYEQAQGKYFAVCEGDDYWTDPLKLQKQFDFMESHPDCSLCFHNAFRFYQDTAKKVLFNSDLENRYYSKEELASKWIIPTASLFLKAAITNDYIRIRKDNEGILVAGDIILYLSAAQKGDVYGMSDIMSVYRLQKSGANSFNYRTPLFFKHFKRVQEIFDLKSPEYKRVLSNAAYSVCLSQLKEREIVSFLKYFLLSIYYKPGQLIRFCKEISVFVFNHFFSSKRNTIQQ